MSKIKAITITDKNGEAKYPKTYTKLVLDANGNDLSEIISGVKNDSKYLDEKLTELEDILNGGKVLYMPPLLKTLNYETGTRLTKYENNALTFGAYGVGGVNIEDSDSDILTKDDAFKLLNIEFWNGNEELKIDFEAEVTQPCTLMLFFYKDITEGASAITFDINSSGAYTWDVKEAIKNNMPTSYTHVNKIAIFGIKNTEEEGSYGNSTVTTKGFYNTVTGLEDSVLVSWILGESFSVVNATYSNGMVESPIEVLWPNGEKGEVSLTKDEQGLVVEVIANIGEITKVLTITRDSYGNVLSTTIN